MGVGCIIVLILLIYFLRIFQQEKNKDVFPSISINDAITAIEEKREMIIYIGEETCGACRTYLPILKKVSLEEQKEIYYLDVDLISSQKQLEKYQIQETPTLINITREEIFIYRGTMSEEDTRKALTETNIEKVELAGVSNIDENMLEELENQAKEFILYIGRDDCGDCQKFNPILEEYLNNNSEGVYFLDIKEYRKNAVQENAKSEDIEKYEALKEKYSIKWVPTLIHIRNGIQVSKFEFLDAQFGDLKEGQKDEYVEEYIQKFYNWMEQRAMGY